MPCSRGATLRLACAQVYASMQIKGEQEVKLQRIDVCKLQWKMQRHMPLWGQDHRDDCSENTPPYQGLSACLWQVGLRGVVFRLLGVQVQGVAATGPRQAVLVGGLPPEAAIQGVVPLLAAGAGARPAGLDVQLLHCMPHLHVQLLHRALGHKTM